MVVLASARMSGNSSRDRTTLPEDGSESDECHRCHAGGTGHRRDASMVDENVPDAPPAPGFDHSAVVEAAAGSARTPYMLPIPAQLAVMLRAQIGSGKLATHRPIPGESTLLRQYGVAPEAARKAVRALVAEGSCVPGGGPRRLRREVRLSAPSRSCSSRNSRRCTPCTPTQGQRVRLGAHPCGACRIRLACAGARRGAGPQHRPPIAAGFAALFPNANLVMKPGGGHSLWLDEPEWFASVVAAFLDDEGARVRC